MCEQPQKTDNFLSEEQRIVVEYRRSVGYECVLQKNGYWCCCKGRHKMVIDGCGYDRHVGVV